MRTTPPRFALAGWIILPGIICATTRGLADPHVVVSATADPDYTQRKYGGEKPRLETYVVMQGHYFEGYTVDHSIERMPFRRIAEIFAPELAQRQYRPAKSLPEADLLILVHWGTTTPSVSTLEMQGRTSPITDTSNTAAGISRAIDEANARSLTSSDMQPQISNSPFGTIGRDAELNRLLDADRNDQLLDQLSRNTSAASSAELLGYTKTLRRDNQSLFGSEMANSLRLDLTRERYFIILRAYDLHKADKTTPARPVWTLHLNMSSAGNNFREAVSGMSLAAVDYVGRTTDGVATIRPKLYEGRVEIGTPVVVGEAK